MKTDSNLREYSVTLKRPNTNEDLNNGKVGRFTYKEILVRCKKQDIRKKVKIHEGEAWIIERITDWGLFKQKLFAEDVKWIFSH